MTRQHARLVVAALSALVLAWLTAGPSGPPLYDGLGFPDEPYRFVQPPVGYQRTAQPSAVSYQVGFDAGGAEIYDVSSDEVGPQVELIVRQRDITLPAGSATLTLRADPVAPSKQPSDGEVWGNVYRVAIGGSGAGGATGGSAAKATVRPDGHTDQIRLRAPTGPPPTPGIEFYDGQSWKRLTATRIGNDLYVAPLAGVGDYALVTERGKARVSAAAPSSAASSTSGTSTGTASGTEASNPAGTSLPPVGSDTTDSASTSSDTARTLLIIALGSVVVLVGLIVIVRLSRRPD